MGLWVKTDTEHNEVVVTPLAGERCMRLTPRNAMRLAHELVDAAAALQPGIVERTFADRIAARVEGEKQK